MPTDLTPKDQIQSANQELTETIKTVLAENMGGLTFFSNGFKRGYGNSIFGSDDNGIWLGAADYVNAPIRFGMDGSGYIGGNVTIGGDVVVEGYIQVGNAAADVNSGSTTISGVQITNNTIAGSKIIANAITADKISVTTLAAISANLGTITAGNITADIITAGTLNVDRISSGAITGSKVANNTITYDKLSVSSLSAISANVGTLTSGTIQGVTVQSGTGSEKIVLDTGDYIRFYAGGNLKCQLRGTTAGSGGLSMTGDLVVENNKSILISSSGGSSYGGISITSGNQFWLTLGTDQTFYIKNNAQTSNYFTVSGSRAFSNTHFESSDPYILLNGNYLQASQNTNFWHHDGQNRDNITFESGLTFGIDSNNHWIHFSDGTDKSAIVPISKGYRALYCAESPEVWFFDFCEDKESIDPMFLEVTEGEIKFIKCNKGYQVWRRRKGHAKKRFEQKTYEQFIKNEKFLNIPKI